MCVHTKFALIFYKKTIYYVLKKVKNELQLAELYKKYVGYLVAYVFVSKP